MIIKNFVAGLLGANNYLVIDEKNKEAVLIDCSEKNDELEEYLRENKINLRYILLTHGHFDHFLGIVPLLETLDFESELKGKNAICPKVLMNRDDEEMVENMEKFLMGFPVGQVDIPQIDGYVEKDETIKVGDLAIKVLFTPGHSEGSVSYLVGDSVFTGDLLFKESVGRTDLYGGDFDTLKKSVTEQIFTLPADTKVYPGHGEPTTVGWEREHNEFM